MTAYYRRGLQWARTVYLPAPTGGWNPDANWWELPDTQAPILDNWLLRSGKILTRGPLVNLNTVTLSSALLTSANFGDALYGSSSPSGVMNLWWKQNDAAKWIDPWNAPLLNAPAANLASGSTTSHQVALDTGTVTSTVLANVDIVGGPRWINFNGLLYGISYDSTGGVVTDTNVTYHMKPLNLLTMPVVQTPGTVATATVLANAPKGAFDLKGYLSRIWLLGGVDTPGGLTVHEPTSLFYTVPLGTPAVFGGGAPGTPLGSAAADWKDPVTGITNKLNMDVNTADFGVGLAQAPNALLVFRHSSVWRLTGSTSSTFVLKPLSKEVGCLDARSIVETDKGVFWVSSRGLMFTDGTTIKNVSGSVQVDMTTAIQQVQQWIQSNQTRSSGYITIQLTSQGHVLITIGKIYDNLAGGAFMQTLWSGMYDPPTGAWTRHTSSIWFSPTPGAGAKLPVLLVGRPGRKQLYSIGNGNGNHKIVQFENAAFANNGTLGASFLLVNKTQQALEDYDLQTTGRTTIPVTWATKVLPLDVSHKQAKLKRYFTDFTLAITTSGPISGGLQAQPWSVPKVAPLDTVQTFIGISAPSTQFVVGGGEQLYAEPQVTRMTRELQNEVSDMYFVVQSNIQGQGAALGPSIQEVYGIGIEFFTARDYEGEGS